MLLVEVRGLARGSIYQRCKKCRKTLRKPSGRGKPRCPECGGTDGFWVGEVTLGTRPDGKRDRRTLYGATREEIEAQITKLLADAQRGLLTDPTRETLAEFLERWLRDVASHTVRPVTLQSYMDTVRPHVLRHQIGTLPLAQLTPMHLQRLYSEKLAEGLSRRTVQYIHRILHRALDQAVKWNLLARNPADAVDVPRPARKEMATLSPEQARALMAVLHEDYLGPLYMTALFTGARRGELIALRWQDVDLKQGTIQINRTAQVIRGKGVVWSEPKTAKSRRLIPLPEIAVEVLKAHRKRQLEQRLRLGDMYHDEDLVFARPDGSPYNGDHVSQHFAILVRRAGLPKIRLHDLRHTHATWLFKEGVHPKIVSERLGHSTTTLTMDVYSHVLPTMQAEAARTIDKVLGGTDRDEQDGQYRHSTGNGS